MSDESILNDWNPSGETLRQWAFDESLLLSDQDEDLVLHRREYLPLLVELADDPSCPKAGYILSCLDFYLMFLVLRGSESHLEIVNEGAQLAASARTEAVVKWGRLQQRRLRYREGSGLTTREQAVEMGEDLLNGISRKSEISLVGETEQAWEIELSVPPLHRHKERLSISKATGQFKFSR